MNDHQLKLRRFRTTGWIIAASIALLLVASVQFPVAADSEQSNTAATANSMPLSRNNPDRSGTITSPPGFSMWRTAAALAGIVVAIIAVGQIGKRFFPGLSAEKSGRAIRVLSQTALGPRATVYVLRCGPRVLVVGSTQNQLTTLAEIADPDEIAEFCRGTQAESPSQPRPKMESLTAEPAAGELRGQLDGMLNQINRWKTTT